MNIIQTVNISTNIHNERIKTKYIPSYIFENEGKTFKKLKKLPVLSCLKLLEQYRTTEQMCSDAHSVTIN